MFPALGEARLGEDLGEEVGKRAQQLLLGFEQVVWGDAVDVSALLSFELVHGAADFFLGDRRRWVRGRVRVGRDALLSRLVRAERVLFLVASSKEIDDLLLGSDSAAVGLDDLADACLDVERLAEEFARSG